MTSKFRAVIFGSNVNGIVRMITEMPVGIENCGMYVHVEDIEAYRKYAAELDCDSLIERLKQDDIDQGET